MTEQLSGAVRALHEACRELPVTVEVFTRGVARADRVAVLLPGGGLNARASFTVGRNRGLAEYLGAHGYLPVGITPREDTQDLSGAADWGLAGHRTDAERALALVEEHLGLPYELLGHSAGAALALDLAAQPGCGARRVLVLDTTGPYDPQREPELVARADALCTELRQRLAAGELTLDPGLKAAFESAGDATDLRARLTFALTRTNEVPGPANWIYHRGHSAGGDALSLDVWSEAMSELGSGVQPLALLRDLAALWAGREDVYRIDWSAIRADLVWINAEHGRGDHDLGPRLVRAGGARVEYRVVPGAGHADVVWGRAAEHAVWPLLLES
jgi:pimeloyl-ACP methyl ester carboxylesterase